MRHHVTIGATPIMWRFELAIGVLTVSIGVWATGVRAGFGRPPRDRYFVMASP